MSFMTVALLAGGLSAHLPGPAALWVPFGLAVLALVALDLGLFQRTPREPTTRQALGWSAVWFGLTVLFGAAVVATRGPARGVEFFTGYVVEQAAITRTAILIYRESRGAEVRHPFFTDQFKGATLKRDGALDRHIDGITGATLSVHAISALARVALLLDEAARAKPP